MNRDDIIQAAQHVIHSESKAVEQLIRYLSKDFAKVVQLIANSKGRVIISGIGKSALIAQKIVATLNSTGTPSAFMHATEAIHGDLGIIQPGDIVVLLSKSGNTTEVKALLPLVKNMKNETVALTGNRHSYLAQNVDYVLDTTVEREACPNNLAPTSSTTAQLVMGDALAICLMKARRFTDGDFARYHPGGALGKRLYLRVADVIDPSQRPAVSPESDLRAVILSISKSRFGLTAVLEGDEIAGIITDGDLRRMLSKDLDLKNLSAREIMTAEPKVIPHDALAHRAMERLEKFEIGQLLVTRDSKYCGVIDIHDLLREGIV